MVDINFQDRIFVPFTCNQDITTSLVDEILARTTHLAISAHQDDVEIMAYHGINACFQSKTNFFTAVIATNGAGSHRRQGYEALSEEEFIDIRNKEQKKAAWVGEYNAVLFLNYASAQLKRDNRQNENIRKEKGPSLPISDMLTEILNRTSPEFIYTHNPFDSHPTHAVLSRCVLDACQKMDLDKKRNLNDVYGCEVWGSLDWIPAAYRISLDVSERPHLQRALIGVFDSQIAIGKSFDEGTMARRRSNATFFDTLESESLSGVNYALSLKAPAFGVLPLDKLIDKLLVDYGQQVKSAILRT